MTTRPRSITIISWILIVLGGISAVSTTIMIGNPMVAELMQKSPVPMWLQWVMSYAGLLVMLVSGAAMLKGANWARWLYVGWTAAGFVFAFATSPLKMAMLPGFVFFCIIAFFLFRKKANAFFVPVPTAGHAQPV